MRPKTTVQIIGECRSLSNNKTCFFIYIFYFPFYRLIYDDGTFVDIREFQHERKESMKARKISLSYRRLIFFEWSAAESQSLALARVRIHPLGQSANGPSGALKRIKINFGRRCDRFAATLSRSWVPDAAIEDRAGHPKINAKERGKPERRPRPRLPILFRPSLRDLVLAKL